MRAMLQGMEIDTGEWGPRLYAYLAAHWRANDTNSNAWTDAHPGIQLSTVSRWRTGTEPRLPALMAVASALDVPLADLLVVIGAAPSGEGHDVQAPATPSIDVAIAQDPNLSDGLRKALRDIVAAWREVETGTREVAGSDDAPRKVTRRRR